MEKHSVDKKYAQYVSPYFSPTYMTTKNLIRMMASLIALFFIIIGIKQIQDTYVGYGFVSLGIGAGILLLAFKNLIKKRFKK